MTFLSPAHMRPDHAASMDRMYRYQRYIYNLTRKYYLIGRDRLLRGLDARPGAQVLEIGCGTGRNMVQVARRNPGTMVYGMDISRQMLTSARSAAARAGVAERMRTACGDAETFDATVKFGVRGFDRVFLSYTLSMIPGWRNALAMAMAQVNDRGSVHIVDFGQMERWPAFIRNGFRRWLRAFHVTPRPNLIGEAERLGRAHGMNVDITPIAGGYALLIVLSRAARAPA